MSENGSACSWTWATTHSGFYESVCISIKGIRASSAMPGQAELQSVRGRLGLQVERDLHFTASKPISAYAREARLAERIVT
ncbi:MAG: DUF2958 domain-containing protein [Sulfuricella sp.]